MRYTGRWPFKKRFTVILGIGLVVYYIAAAFIICTTWQKNLPLAYGPQRYEGEWWMVWAVAACVAAVVLGGYIKSLHRRIDILLEQRERAGRLAAK